MRSLLASFGLLVILFAVPARGSEEWVILSYLNDSDGEPVDARIEGSSSAAFAEQQLAEFISRPSTGINPVHVLKAHGFDPRKLAAKRTSSPRHVTLVHRPPGGARPLRSFDIDFSQFDAEGVPEGRYHLRLQMDDRALVQQAELMGRQDLPAEVADFIADNLLIENFEALPDRWVLILNLRVNQGQAAAIASSFAFSDDER